MGECKHAGGCLLLDRECANSIREERNVLKAHIENIGVWMGYEVGPTVSPGEIADRIAEFKGEGDAAREEHTALKAEVERLRAGGLAGHAFAEVKAALRGYQTDDESAHEA